MKRAPRDPELARRWLAFLRNHREAMTAMDFFTVPTVAFQLLYCFFIIRHDRRQILHFNITRQPTSNWIVQQLREAFPYQSAPKFLLFDHDQKYGLEVRCQPFPSVEADLNGEREPSLDTGIEEAEDGVDLIMIDKQIFAGAQLELKPLRSQGKP